MRAAASAMLLALSLLASACAAGDPKPAEARAEPSPAPSPSPSASPEAGPVAPLTGVEVADDGTLDDRPVLGVKIENTAQARPQAGLEAADVVYEELAEGGVTRFLALFHSDLPDTVGPVRSARLADADVLPAYSAALGYSGARGAVDAALLGAGIQLFTEGHPGFYRESSRSAPHNLFAEPATVAELATDAGVPPADDPGWVRSDEAPDGDCDACDGESIEIPMSQQSVTGWSYDAAAGVYRRQQNGSPSEVTGDGEIGAANVVVLGTEIVDVGCCDTAGSSYTEASATGEGEAIVLRDGRWYEVSWSKASAGDQLELTDADGEPVPLGPGPTWIHLAPAGRLP